MAGTLPVPEKEKLRPAVMSKGGPQSGPGPSTPKRDHALPFLEDDSYTDLVLVVEGKKLYINRSLIGYASSHFDKMLSGFHGEKSKSVMEIKIVGKVYQEFVDILSLLHPAVNKELNDKMAVRLLPLTEEYQMTVLKEKCEKVLLSHLKRIQAEPKSPTHTPYRKRRDDPSEILLRYIKAAEAGCSRKVLEQCVRMYSESDISLKELKTCSEVSDQVKAQIFKNRMEAASSKLEKITSELEREKQENEMLKKQRAGKFPKFNNDTMPLQPRPTPSKKEPSQRQSLVRPLYNNTYSKELVSVSKSTRPK